MQLFEERVGIADVAVGVPGQQEQHLAGCGKRVEQDRVLCGRQRQLGDQSRRVITVASRCPPGHPHQVAVHRGGAQGAVHRRHSVRDLDSCAEPFQDRPPGERVLPVAEQRPVAELRRRRPTPAERDVPAACPETHQLIEDGGVRRLRRGAPSELRHRTVPEPVEDEQHHREPVVLEGRLARPVSGPPHRRAAARRRSHRTGLTAPARPPVGGRAARAAARPWWPAPGVPTPSPP